MLEPKVKCSRCGVEFLQATARANGGLCVPCKKGRPPQPGPEELKEVSCTIRGGIVFSTSARVLLEGLEAARPVGGPTHPNHAELAAQKALLCHAIANRVPLELHDDHWCVTSGVLLALFETGNATLQVQGKTYHFSDLTKDDWRAGNQPLAMMGGFRYRDAAGTEIFQKLTWMS